MGPASPEQLERAYWVGWDGSKLAKESLRILAHACTCPDISYTCANIPKHACTCPNIPARPWNRLKAGLRTAMADAGSCISPNSPRRRSPNTKPRITRTPRRIHTRADRREGRHAPLRRFPRSAIGPRRMPQRGFPDLEVARFTQTAIRKRGQAPYTLYEVEARYTTSGSQSPFQDSHCVPRRRPHPGTKGGSTTLLVDGYGPQLKL